MTEMPEIGKVSPDVFEKMILPFLGAHDSSVLVGPQNGVDVGIAEIGGKAVAVTTDPVFIVPEYGWERAAWFAIHIIASDCATSGLRPRYLSIDLNLPMEMTSSQLNTVWQKMHSECEKLGITVITGHTGRYENCHYPMVGGATMIGVGDIDKYVTPRLAKEGDNIIITKGPAIEASGIFATMFPGLLEKEYGTDFSRRAQDIFFKMSTVEDALAAVSVGVREDGVTAMHDATECGIWGGLFEIAQAAGLGVTVEMESIVVEDCVSEICSYFGIDPYASISEGTLIISCRPHKTQNVLKALQQKGISASVAGELTRAQNGMTLVRNGKAEKLAHPGVDPFWRAFYDALPRVG
ncbi:MAG: AIR synthase family protein [Dehalococcoidia bacterium]|nr:AIR synthase family protein [Dehalococcoidia bacterium]